MSLRVFRDAVVIMTGGASGIGRTMSRELVRRGAQVLLADRDLELAQKTAEELGDRASAVECNVVDFAQVKSVVDQTFETHGRLDFMFNNAGIGISGEVIKGDVESWSRVLDVNIRGVVHGVQAAYPRMVDQGFGHVINTASMAGLLPTPGIVSYGTSKHAVVGLSKSLRLEAERHNVFVSALCPGFIRTPILTGGKYGGSLEPISEEVQLRSIERLRPMDPDEFAEKAIDAIGRNDAIIIFPKWYRALWFAHRLSPRLGRALSRRMFSETRRTLENQG